MRRNSVPEPLPPPFASDIINLASPRMGAAVIFATDEFFASKERLIEDTEPQFIPDKYDSHGKWMDGWESRRRRDGGYDHCIISLKAGGTIEGVDIDTRHFTGNHPPYASIDGALSKSSPNENTIWMELVPKTKIKPDAQNFIEVKSSERLNYLRFNIYPDGGIARLRIYGHPTAAWEQHDPLDVYELSAITNGGRIVGYNDAHYGTPWVILSSGRGVDMGDGWETRRRREPGNDWIIIALGARGIVERIEIDTAHFKGNYPDRCSVEAITLENTNESSLLQERVNWLTLMDEQTLSMDHIHNFQSDLVNPIGPATHLRLSIYPDGGVSRFRAFGRLASPETT